MGGKKVLVVDCDLRNPSQNVAFEVENGAGLSEYLSGQVEELIPTPTFRENLDLILTGKRPPNPTELLSSERMKALLATLREEYDVIFLDLPPVGMMSDAAAVADRTDGYVLVVESGESETQNLDRAMELLSNVGAKILGLVLNNVSQKNGHYGYGRYGRYGKYGRYGRYGRYGAPAENGEVENAEKKSDKKEEE
jgi:capsular exopolysaccharide synthesis family protein